MKGLIIQTMYRDAANFKDCSEEILFNDTELSANEISELYNTKIGFYEPVIAEDLGLVNIAPFDNEFLELGNSLDHPYIEIIDFEDTKIMTKNESLQLVSVFVDRVKNYPSYRKLGKVKRLQKAKDELALRIKELTANLKTISNYYYKSIKL